MSPSRQQRAPASQLPGAGWQPGCRRQEASIPATWVPRGHWPPATGHEASSQALPASGLEMQLCPPSRGPVSAQCGLSEFGGLVSHCPPRLPPGPGLSTSIPPTPLPLAGKLPAGGPGGWWAASHTPPKCRVWPTPSLGPFGVPGGCPLSLVPPTQGTLPCDLLPQFPKISKGVPTRVTCPLPRRKCRFPESYTYSNEARDRAAAPPSTWRQLALGARDSWTQDRGLGDLSDLGHSPAPQTPSYEMLPCLTRQPSSLWAEGTGTLSTALPGRGRFPKQSPR